MQIKKYTFGLLLGMFGMASSVAQTLDTDGMPGRSVAEKIVQATAQAQAVPTVVGIELTNDNAAGETIVRTALQYLGARYRSGHSGPTSFDCSGFTSYVYRQEDINITRSSRSQYTQGTSVKKSELRKGDLVFFGGSRSTRTVGHVGIVTDVDPANNRFKFVHASRSGVKVDDSNSAYYSRRYIGARRILNN